MQDIEGLLNKNKTPSAVKTMTTTAAVYIPRARELGEDRLVLQLISDRNSERAAFINAQLIVE